MDRDALKVCLDITSTLGADGTSRSRYARGLLRELPLLLGAGDTLTLAWKLSRYRSTGRLPRFPRAAGASRVRVRPYLRSLASWMVPGHVFHCTRRGGPRRHGGTILETVLSLDLFFGEYEADARNRAQELRARLAARDGLLFLTERSRRRFLEISGFPDARAFVVPLGFDPGDFHPQPVADDAAVLRRHGIERPYVLCVASVERRKNQARLCEAFARSGVTRGLDLILVGKDRHHAAEAHDAARRDLPQRCRFLGPLPEADLPALLRHARAFALPSLYEEQGMVFLEALAAGVPVLGPDLDTTREILGACAVLAEPTSVEALAAGLDAVVADETLRAKLRREGLERVQRYAWPRVAEQTLAVYRTLASQGKR